MIEIIKYGHAVFCGSEANVRRLRTHSYRSAAPLQSALRGMRRLAKEEGTRRCTPWRPSGRRWSRPPVQAAPTPAHGKLPGCSRSLRAGLAARDALVECGWGAPGPHEQGCHGGFTERLLDLSGCFIETAM